MNPARCTALAAALGVCAGAAPAAEMPAEITDLMRLWSGVHDSAVQVILDDRSPRTAAADLARLRTVIEPVDLPWLGATVLYLEETPHDVPGAPRRQLLLRLSIDSQLRPQRIRVRQFTLKDPAQWRGLFADPQAQRALRRTDVETLPGCDLLLSRDGDQFEGGTLGRGCVWPPADPQRYVDYRLQVGAGLYWFRSRQFRFEDDALVQESAGYDWPALHLARLYSCRIRWSASGARADLAPLLALSVADRGGHAEFSLPDGRAMRLTLHSDDWPFDASNQALVLTLQDLAPGGAVVHSWTSVDGQVTAAMKVMDARCGPVVPSASRSPASMRR
ncbi:MAG TPA: CpcT/CpeT family chromophore lyase [Steroidobacteraceae bacterium]|nr:CpcT/CpeT family chromophore lyase [Steroidobacteraceae bacterium]